jgi:preprotein translocase subunit SecB
MSTSSSNQSYLTDNDFYNEVISFQRSEHNREVFKEYEDDVKETEVIENDIVSQDEDKESNVFYQEHYDEIALPIDENNKKIAIAEAQFDLSGGQQSQSSSYLKIELNTVGIFELEEEVSDLDQIKNDLHAAMFPYVRAYITTITSLSGLPPITLPDMSIVDM